jgi:hypothetical protein
MTGGQFTNLESAHDHVGIAIAIARGPHPDLDCTRGHHNNIPRSHRQRVAPDHDRPRAGESPHRVDQRLRRFTGHSAATRSW